MSSEARDKLKINPKKAPGVGKKLSKEQRKKLEKALKQALVLSSDGQIAVISDGRNNHIMMKETTLNEALQNVQKGMGFVVDPPKELKEFSEAHREVLTVMSKLNYERLSRDEFDSDEDYEAHLEIVEKNENLFNEIDSFTFSFSQGLMSSKNERKKVMEEYKEFREKHKDHIEAVLQSKVVESKVV